MALMLFYQLRLKGAGTIAGRLQLKLAGGTLHFLLGFTVPAVRRHFVGQVAINLTFQRRLCQLLDQGCQNAILTRIACPDCNAFRALSKSNFSAMVQSSLC